MKQLPPDPWTHLALLFGAPLLLLATIAGMYIAWAMIEYIIDKVRDDDAN